MGRAWTFSCNRLPKATVYGGGTLWVALLLASLAGLVGLSGLSGCGVVSRSVSSRSPAEATATPIPTPPVPAASSLRWAADPMPVAQQPGGLTGLEPTLGSAQSDSATAYVCAPSKDSSNSSVSTWLTRNRGASWQATGSISVDVGTPTYVAGCQIIVDATEADTAVAQISVLQAGECMPIEDCVAYVLYLSTNMGQHWAEIQAPTITPNSQEPLDGLFEFATYHQVTYALFHSAPQSLSTPSPGFMVSHDNLHNWTPVAALAEVPVSSFWLNPFNGSLLVMNEGGGYNQVSFLTSSDGAADWTTLAAPPFPFEFYDVVVQQPFTDQPWRICGGDPSNAPQNPHMDSLACTADSGASWVIHQLAVPNDRGGGPDSGANYTLVGIADDGSALLITPLALERVVNGSPGMQSLGPAPNAGLMTYAAGGGEGGLWSAPRGGYTDSEPYGRIFTARYV